MIRYTEYTKGSRQQLEILRQELKEIELTINHLMIAQKNGSGNHNDEDLLDNLYDEREDLYDKIETLKDKIEDDEDLSDYD